MRIYFCVETSIKQSRGGTFPSPIPLPFETNVAIEVVIIGWKKICLSLNSMDTIWDLKCRIKDLESLRNEDPEEWQVSCITYCCFHSIEVREKYGCADETRIADCYTVISGKYYYPWTWNTPWFKQGFI